MSETRRKRRRFLSACLILCGAAAGAVHGVARASEVDLSSDTALHLFSRDLPGGSDARYAPVYERIAVDVWGVGSRELSAHGYVWARLDLGEESGDGKAAGSVESAYMAYNGPMGGAQARLGRFLLAEGTLAATIDGVFVKARGPFGLGASLFAGRPVQDTDTPPKHAGSMTGGRVSFASPGTLEGGVTLLQGQGQLADGDDRREVGADLWFRPLGKVTFSGVSVHNRVTSRTARTKAEASVAPSGALTLTAGAENYSCDDLLGSAFNPAFSRSTLGVGDEVAIRFASVQWRPTARFEVVAGGRRTTHLLSDPGDATLGEVRFRLDLGGGGSVSLSSARQSADQPENAYSELHGYVAGSKGPWSLSLDALSQTYDEPINGENNTYQVVGSAGRRMGRSVKVSADARFTSSPTFKEDVSLLLRIELGTDR